MPNPTPINLAHSTASVTNASTTVLVANANRRYALIVNDGASDVYLNLGGTAVANTGIRVNNGGGSYEISAEHGNLFTGIIKGITSSGTSVCTVTEGT